MIGIRPSSGVAYWSVQIFSEGDGGTADRAIGVQALDSSGSHVCSKYMGNFAMGDTTKWYHVVTAVDTTQSINERIVNKANISVITPSLNL